MAALCRASGLRSLVLKLGVEHVAAADGGDVVACRRSLLVCRVRRKPSSPVVEVRVGWEESLAGKEVCRVAERRLSLRTVPPEVAGSGAETCEMYVSYLESIQSRISTPNGSSFRGPSWVPDSLAIRKGGDVPKATERSRTRPRLSMPVMGLMAILGYLLKLVGLVWVADWYRARQCQARSRMRLREPGLGEGRSGGVRDLVGQLQHRGTYKKSSEQT